MSASKMTQGQSSRRVLMGARGKTPSGVASNRHPGKRSFLQMIKNPANTALLLALVSHVAHSATDPSVSQQLQKQLDDMAEDALGIQRGVHQDNIHNEDAKKLRQLEERIELLKSGYKSEDPNELAERVKEHKEMRREIRKKMNRMEPASSQPPMPVLETGMNAQLDRILNGPCRNYITDRDAGQLKRLVEAVISVDKDRKEEMSKHKGGTEVPAVEKLTQDLSNTLLEFEQEQETVKKNVRWQMMLPNSGPIHHKEPQDYSGMSKKQLLKQQEYHERQHRICTKFLRDINAIKEGAKFVRDSDRMKLLYYKQFYASEIESIQDEFMERQSLESSE